MEPSDLSPFLQPIEPTVSMYTSVESDTPAESVVAVALSGLDQPPSWLDRSDVAAAIDSARSIDAAGVAWFGRASGCLSAPLVDPPRHDVVEVGPVPRLLPLIETMHRSVWHVAVVVDLPLGQVHFFEFPDIREASAWDVSIPDTDPATIARVVLDQLPDRARVLVVAVEPDIRTALVDRLDNALPPSVAVYSAEPRNDFTDEVVKAVADHSATDLVHALRTFRFLGTHGVVAEGFADTAAALSHGRVTKLFLSPATERARLHVGEAAQDISATCGSEQLTVRASDALLRSAILQGSMVQAIPEHLADGPAEGVGATLVSS